MNFPAQSPDLRHFPLVAGALRFSARSPRLAAPHIRFLFVDSRFRYRFFQRRPRDRTGSSPASSPCDLLGVVATNFPRGLPPPIHAHAGHTEPDDHLKEVVLLVPNRFGVRPAPKTFFSMLVLSLAIPIAALTRRYVLAGALVASEGLLMIAFPFATPETVNRLGFGASIALVRVVAFFVILIGAFLATGI